MPSAIQAVPCGAWAVGVSGGADSVALLRLLRDRPDLRLQVAHLDHETRGGASTDDARFVADLAARLGLACTVARLCEVELDEASRHRQSSRAISRRALEVVQAGDRFGKTRRSHSRPPCRRSGGNRFSPPLSRQRPGGPGGHERGHADRHAAGRSTVTWGGSHHVAALSRVDFPGLA